MRTACLFFIRATSPASLYFAAQAFMYGSSLRLLMHRITGLLVIDPYNEFISEGGKVRDRLKGIADANKRRSDVHRDRPRRVVGNGSPGEITFATSFF
jgi:hypothetical protein